MRTGIPCEEDKQREEQACCRTGMEQPRLLNFEFNTLHSEKHGSCWSLTQNTSYFSASPSFELLIQQANHLQPYGVVEQLKIHSHRKQTLASSTFMMPELQKTATHKNRHFQTGNRLCLQQQSRLSLNFSVSLPQQTTKTLIFHTALENKRWDSGGEEELPALPKPFLPCPRRISWGQRWNPAPH